jgi:hypothetical protein
MKRLVIISVCIWLLGTASVHGQFIKGMGVKGGLSLADQAYQYTPLDYSMETDMVIGPSAVLFIEFIRRNRLGLQLDLAYIPKGSKTTTHSVTVDHLNDDRLIVNKGEMQVSRFHYLSVAPLVSYHLGGGMLRPYLAGGPRMDVLLSYECTSEYPLEEQNSLIPGLSLGAGADFQLGPLGMFLEVQYQGDIIPVTGVDPLLVNNHVVLVLLGLKFSRN